jgi:hypothetical protein
MLTVNPSYIKAQISVYKLNLVKKCPRALPQLQCCLQFFYYATSLQDFASLFHKDVKWDDNGTLYVL